MPQTEKSRAVIDESSRRGWGCSIKKQRMKHNESGLDSYQKEGSSWSGSKTRKEVTNMTNLNEKSNIANSEEVHQTEKNRSVINESSTRGFGCSLTKQRIESYESGWCSYRK